MFGDIVCADVMHAAFRIERAFGYNTVPMTSAVRALLPKFRVATPTADHHFFLQLDMSQVLHLSNNLEVHLF